MYVRLHVVYAPFLSDFDETWIFSADFLKKYSNINYHENLSSGSGVISCGRTEGHGKASSRFSQCCERAWKPYLSFSCSYAHLLLLPLQPLHPVLSVLLLLLRISLVSTTLRALPWSNLSSLSLTACSEYQYGLSDWAFRMMVWTYSFAPHRWGL